MFSGIAWLGAKLVAVKRLLKDKRREVRDRWSALYPHGVVRQACRRFPEFAGMEVLIETGTFKGKTARQESRYFREVHTVELNAELYESSASTFVGPYANVHAYHGDSVEVLPRILDKLREPCVLFLDAHWSGGPSVDWSDAEWQGYGVETSYRGTKWPPDPEQQCPLVQEARIIIAHPYRCIVIIDDWDVAGTRDRKFRGEDWSTISLERVLSALDCERVHAHFISRYKDKQRLVILINPA